MLPKHLPLFLLTLTTLASSAQLPDCSNNRRLGYFLTPSGIHCVDFDDPSQSFPNTINVPPDAMGLVISRNLNAPTPATTFYTVINKKYHYYDGNAWVNTNHYAGEGVNPGGGGGYIFNKGPAGMVHRYDGTGDAQLLVTTGIAGVADIPVDQCGNFYLMKNSSPQGLMKYNAEGELIETFVVLGAPLYTGGGGIVIIGNEVYYDDMSVPGPSQLLHGVISGGAVDFLPSGIFLADVTDAASCPSAATRVETTDTLVCATALPFTWMGNSYSHAGTYTHSTTGNSGCDSVAILNLGINAAIPVTNIDSGVCITSLPIDWNGITITGPGSYSVTLAGISGCDSVVNMTLTVSPVPDPPVATSLLQYCRFEDAPPLTASGPGEMIWHTTATGGTGSLSAPKPSTAEPGTRIYYVSNRVNGCESFRTPVSVSVLPAPLLGPDQLVRLCFGTSINLNSLPESNEPGTWTIDASPVPNPASVSEAGNYRLVVTNSMGCSDTLLAELRIQPQLFANAGANDSIMIGFLYQLQGSGGLHYEWSPASVLNDPFISNPTATLVRDTEFSLAVRDELGCAAYDTVFIKAYEGTEIWLPTAFTPDGDGRNDIFRILSSAIKRLDHFRIFNRLGEVVFDTRDVSRGWDGTYKGMNQETGTYIWSLQALDNQGRLRNMKGAFTLIR